MATRKHPFSLRLSPEALHLIDQLADHLGLSKTSVVEMAVRQLGRRELTDQTPSQRRSRAQEKMKPLAVP